MDLDYFKFPNTIFSQIMAPINVVNYLVRCAFVGLRSQLLTGMFPSTYLI